MFFTCRKCHDEVYAENTQETAVCKNGHTVSYRVCCELCKFSYWSKTWTNKAVCNRCIKSSAYCQGCNTFVPTSAIQTLERMRICNNCTSQCISCNQDIRRRAGHDICEPCINKGVRKCCFCTTLTTSRTGKCDQCPNQKCLACDKVYYYRSKNGYCMDFLCSEVVELLAKKKIVEGKYVSVTYNIILKNLHTGYCSDPQECPDKNSDQVTRKYPLVENYHEDTYHINDMCTGNVCYYSEHGGFYEPEGCYCQRTGFEIVSICEVE